jgi:GT2 family glycosyltransferase
VIDNDSSDGTMELGKQFPTVEWTRWHSNKGYMAARNYWMTSAREDYFVSLDDDAWFMDGDEIAVAIEVLEKNPKVGAVAFDILSPDKPHKVARGEPRSSAMFIGCGHVLRLAAVRAVGAYESVPGSYGGEEKDLCLRLMDSGYKIIRLPGVHVWHDKTPVSRELAAQHRSGVCNDLVMTLRRTPAVLLPLALMAKFYRHSVFSFTHGLMPPCFQGFKMFARSMPAVLRSRQPVRAETLRTFMRLSGD